MMIHGNFAVNDVPFASWFNETFRLPNRLLFPNDVETIFFEDFMTYLRDLTGKTTITLNEFIGHFTIIYNETGGKFQPLREIGSIRYFFEPNNRGKVSYNITHINDWSTGNQLAGNQLKAWGLISKEDEVNTWNSQKFPAAVPWNILSKVVDCDFYKYRGGGFNQITWQQTYQATLQPLIAPKDIDSLTDKEMTALIRDVRISSRMFYNFINNSTRARAAIEQLSEGSFTAYGNLVSGGWRYYVENIFEPRCKLLQEALSSKEITPLMIYAIDGLGLDPEMIKRLQEVIVNQGNIEASRIIWQSGGIDGFWGASTQKAFEILELHLSDIYIWAYEDFDELPDDLSIKQVLLVQKGLVNSGFSEVAEMVYASGGVDGVLGRSTRGAFRLWKEKTSNPLERRFGR